MILLAVPPLAFVMLAALAVWALFWGGASGDRGGPIAHMRDVASEVSADVRDLASRGLAKTNALALDPRVRAVIARGDRSEAERLANDLLAQSLELDIVAIFDASGSLLALNTVGHGGVPIPREKLDVLYNADFSARGVVQGCLRDRTVETQMEFQTACDFTPPIFGSSGLSVAFSAPVPGAGEGERAGVVSTRLNFRRVTELLRENSFVRAGNGVYLVSDTGGFFDEEINAGIEPAPLSRDQVLATVGHGDGASDGDTIVRRDGVVLLGRGVPASEAVEGGGMSVLLRASEAWVTGEVMRAKRLAAGALIGSLLAACAWGLYVTARGKQQRAQLALDAERARTAAIVESLGEGVLSADAAGRVVFVNKAACATLKEEPAALIGRDVRSVFSEPEGVRLDTAWRLEQATLRRTDGSAVPARVTCALAPDGSAVLTVSDLTEKLETDRRLLEATRHAGMAEVATGILHNVGNVLNSVNVSTSVVSDKLRRSEIGNLVRAGAIIEEHRADLPRYIENDDRGKHLPGFLIEVARKLGAEQKTLLQELDAVTKGIEHVKHIVSLQQEHAKRGSTTEVVNPAELFETALQLQVDSLTRHGVEVEKHFAAVPQATLDKHLVLQILVNLITNARQAMQGLAPGERRITLTVGETRTGDARRLRMEVKDNGVGIPAENLQRVFAQGFTTKKDGHGFGLHSAANAARQMGGTLTANSEGAGKGATFVLELPLVKGGVARPVGATMKEAA
ncbi:MAG TPA: ATP-binding protein [Phycisphaerales bacterium]|nr:ATP-binding protein [Phycisphaerales bacterium]